jgi:hypothetical protein
LAAALGLASIIVFLRLTRDRGAPGDAANICVLEGDDLIGPTVRKAFADYH